MRSELFRIPNEVYGVPLFGVGLLLLCWLGVAGYLVWASRKSPATFRELVAQWPFFLVIAAAIIFLPRFFPTGLPIRGYGVMLVMAGLAGLGMAIYRARQSGIDSDTIISLAFWMFIAGIAAARVFFVIEHWETGFAGLPAGEVIFKAFNFTSGGLVVYGAVLGAGIAFVVFCNRYSLRVLSMADIIAPSLLAGLALGRIGCLMHGCCFGGPCDLPWAVTFPAHSPPQSAMYTPPYGDQVSRGEMHGIRLEQQPDESVVVVRVDTETASEAAPLQRGDIVESINGVRVDSLDPAAVAIQAAYAKQLPLELKLDAGATAIVPAAQVRDRSRPIHPTQIYSSINAALMATLLWFVYRVRGRDGVVIGLALTIYPVARFLLEAIRTDETSFLGTGFSISQNISMALLALMPVYWLLIFRQAPLGSQQYHRPEPAKDAA